MTLRALFAIPGDPETPTGGYVYDARLQGAAMGAGLDLPLLRLPAGFPDPSPNVLAQTLAILARADAPLLIDGLALGTLPEAAIRALPVPVIAMHHHPLGLETGLPPARSAALLAEEAGALRACVQVITTSRTTADTLIALLGVPAGKITVAAPGLDRAAMAPRTGHPPVILGVGTISRRKGWDVLVDALAQIAGLDWTCVLVGPDDRDPEAAAALRAQISAVGLWDRIRLTGALSAGALHAAYQGADIFCLPSRYEGYGMVAAEAMANGLPVVVSHAGALPEAVGDAGLLVPPGDAPALADALARLLGDRPEADRRAAASHARAQTLPGWDRTAEIVANAIREVLKS
jgi:glycosyltransferase involved in cell wall biosynthesis